jgi:hypothetical protein
MKFWDSYITQRFVEDIIIVALRLKRSESQNFVDEVKYCIKRLIAMGVPINEINEWNKYGNRIPIRSTLAYSV